MVIRPVGYAIWERMQAEMDARIKAAGARERVLPAASSRSRYLRREAEHVEGFSPELAVVTIGGGKQLDEPVVVRPTSETVIGEFMAQVGAVLPRPAAAAQPVGQRACAGRCAPRLFLRTTEFLWQEGHTAHATEADARDYARKILHEVYEDFMVDGAGDPGRGRPQDHAGALRRRDQHVHAARR